MVFKCPLVNRNLFSLNHKKVTDLLLQNGGPPPNLFLERDTTYDKCKHAIKIVC